MITDINSEDHLVQKTFADYLHNTLGWNSAYAWNDEDLWPRRKPSALSGLNFGVVQTAVFVEPLRQQGGSHEQEVYRAAHG